MSASPEPVFLNSNFDVRQGEPFTLEISGCDKGCTLVLQTGPAANLKDVKVLKTDATNGDFTVTLDGLDAGTYNFKLTSNNGSGRTYSSQFRLTSSSGLGGSDGAASAQSGSAVPSRTTSSNGGLTTTSTSTTSTSTSRSASTSTPPPAEDGVPANRGPLPSSTSSSLSQDTAISQPTTFLTSIGETPTISGALATQTTLESSPSDSSNGLSSGALAGIVVGVVGGVLLVLVGAFLWWRRRKQKRGDTGPDGRHPQIPELEQPRGGEKLVTPVEIHGSTPPPQAAELASKGIPSVVKPQELDGEKEVESDLTTPAAELQGGDKPATAELSAAPPAAVTTYEMDSGQQPTLKQALKSPALSTLSPDTGVTIMPEAFGGNTSPVSPEREETDNSRILQATSPPARSELELMDQYAQLEARRKRILELERIEEEQARLKLELSKLPKKV